MRDMRRVVVRPPKFAVYGSGMNVDRNTLPKSELQAAQWT